MVHFRVLPDVESDLKIGKKSGRKRLICTLFRVQCAFPNMESEAVLNEKLQ
jgi:hypothetical protein